MTDPVLRIVDAEAGGDISRVIVAGAPPLRGDTVAAKRDDFAARYDHLRWKLIQPPHGELHMCPVLLVDAAAEGADFGVIIMESMGYPPISGSNLFCATAVALAEGMAAVREPETRLTVATPGGLVPITARRGAGGCVSVAFENSPACIRTVIAATAAGPAAEAAEATVVSAGVDYAAVDALGLGVPLTPAAQERLLAHGERLADRARTDFVLFHEAIATREAAVECRVAVFQKPAVICRSPTGTGTSALLTLAYARGLVQPGTVLTTRSPWGGRFQGRITAVQDDGSGHPRVHTSISGTVRVGPASTIA